jgi:hypothetical protein
MTTWFWGMMTLTLILLQAAVTPAQRKSDWFVSTGPITLEEFKTMFNKEAGIPRLALLLSPT